MPGCFNSQIRLRIIAVFNEDILYRGFADIIPQINNLIRNLPKPPSWIFFFELNYQTNDFISDSRPSNFCTILTAIVFFRNEFAKPAQNCIRSK